MAGPLRGWGGKGPGHKEKNNFFWNLFLFQRSNLPTAIKLKGEEGFGLNGPAINRRTFFCGFPYLKDVARSPFNSHTFMHVSNVFQKKVESK